MHNSPAQPTVAISACLVGELVRYDGGHRHNPLLATDLAPHVRWLPLCPEVGAGLGTPRPPVSLYTSDTGLRMMTRDNGTDHTDAMAEYITQQITRLKNAGIAGCILKARSPSCGVGDVPHFDGEEVSKLGSGLFAEAMQKTFANLPIATEAQLTSVQLCNDFVQRVRSFAGLSETFDNR